MPSAAKKTIVLISLTALIGVPVAAQAQGFDSMMRQFMGSSKGGKNGGTQAIIRQNISTRQAQIESEISAGVTAGKLNRQEENDLRSELNRIEAQEGQFLSDGNLDNNETQILVDALTQLTLRMQSYMTNTAYVGTGGAGNRDWFKRYGGPNAGSGNQGQRQARIDTRVSELSSKIQQGVMSGRLNQRDSSRLQSDLNQIVNQENQALADGRLNYNEQQSILAALDSLDSRMTQQLSYGGGGGWNRGGNHGGNRWGSVDGSLLRQRINSGLASGQLKQWEANVLLSKEQQIATIQQRLATAGPSLSYPEAKNLNDQMQALSRDVGQELSKKNVW